MQLILNRLAELTGLSVMFGAALASDPRLALAVFVAGCLVLHLDWLTERRERAKKEAAGRAAALEESEKWYAQNERFLGAFPRALFRAWQVQHLREDASVLEHWQAVEELICTWDPIVNAAVPPPRVYGRRINPDDV